MLTWKLMATARDAWVQNFRRYPTTDGIGELCQILSSVFVFAHTSVRFHHLRRHCWIHVEGIDLPDGKVKFTTSLKLVPQNTGFRVWRRDFNQLRVVDGSHARSQRR